MSNLDELFRTEYYIVTATTVLELERLVNEMLRYGWTPIGGVGVSAKANQLYTQALTREMPNENTY